MRRLLATLAVAFGLAPAPALAQPLVADLSDHLVSITTGFTGTKVLLFGAIEGEGEVVVVVHGPVQTVTVRRKERFAGIWLNMGELTFDHVPAFYQFMATKPPGDWLPERLRKRHNIGVEYLSLALENAGVSDAEPPGADEYRKALVRNKLRLGHYAGETGKVSMLSSRLFRTDIAFPTNVPTGIYTVEVFLVRDGTVVSAESTPLYVSKIGVGAEIYGFAYDYSLLYGIAAVLFAVLAGLGANAIFRKV